MRQIAFVTGGTRGIGRAVAQNLAADHDVVVTWRTTPPQDDRIITVSGDWTL